MCKCLIVFLYELRGRERHIYDEKLDMVFSLTTKYSWKLILDIISMLRKIDKLVRCTRERVLKKHKNSQLKYSVSDKADYLSTTLAKVRSDFYNSSKRRMQRKQANTIQMFNDETRAFTSVLMGTGMKKPLDEFLKSWTQLSWYPASTTNRATITPIFEPLPNVQKFIDHLELPADDELVKMVAASFHPTVKNHRARLPDILPVGLQYLRRRERRTDTDSVLVKDWHARNESLDY